MAGSLSELIASRKAVVGVVGLGYVGLPLIHAFVESGFQTIGYDVDGKKVDILNSGGSYIGHIDAGWVAESVNSAKVRLTTDMSQLAVADAILICVPTPLNQSRDPDLQYVTATASQVSNYLRPGQLVVLESTTYPGTTRDVVLPILTSSGLELGDDFFLAYSPEREDPGNPEYSVAQIPKVVGGMDTASLQLASQLYATVVQETVPVSSCEVAEACKILENTYRSVNIAMVNELKVLFDRIGIDIWDVIDAAKTKPFGFHAFYPGPGLGGHCIPIDPFYLSWVARKNNMSTRFIELAGEINASMPKFVVDRVADALNTHCKPVRGSKIGLLGVAYKKNVDDPRESPAFRLMEMLSAKGAELSYNDPRIARLPSMRHYVVPDLASQELTSAYLAAQDCVLIVTDHSDYDYSFIVKHAPLIVDTRNATARVGHASGKVFKA